MKIEQLDSGTILVTLAREDMRDLRLDLEVADDEVKDGMLRLLYRVGERCGLDHRGKSYLIEALPARDGCLLIISVHSVKRRRVYRIKRDNSREVCIFDSADALLDRLLAGGFLKSGVWLYRGRYILLLPPILPRRERARLSEYGRLMRADAVAVARVKEYGTLLRI